MTRFDESTSSAVLPEGMRGHWYNDSAFDADDPWASLRADRTAIVLVDLINWQSDPAGTNLQILRAAGSTTQADHLERRLASTLLPRLVEVLAAARNAGVLVVHARLATRTYDASDVVPALAPYVHAAGAREGTWGADPLPALGPDPRDLSVVKSGSGAFTGSDLDRELRSRGIDTLLWAGAVTNACVLLSVSTGFDLGYRQYLVTDCTAALSDADQAAAKHFIGAYPAQLVTAVQVLDALV
ncbi:isochorismatase family cysteine hydrolase [Aeromicrobium ginsengisoli]|uniref:Cysteine hydrolase n=1 Tax=Aeromicrobium ginsengisoli TaxID=363867 RepID=A0A5M4F982_9ACTN|nr:isochorismatase family cysteine hydrolase [Aeromicrobium ginsengisoli]KAA1394268.1 cysteine hydrolase [Aeromicrobium ginsengisoli]